MLMNQHRYDYFLHGVTQYQHSNYHNAVSSFLSSMSEQLNGNHEFMLNHEHQSKNSYSIGQKMNNHIQVKKQRVFCGSYQTLLNLSCCWIKQNQINKAQKLCYRALQFNAYGSLAYYNLAIVHIRKGNYLQALSQMKSALSCQYLRKYERTFDKHCLDTAISLSPNNLQAIKYRIGMNSNFLQFIKHLSSIETVNNKLQDESSSIEVTTLEVFMQEEQAGRLQIMNQLRRDMESLRKFNRTYEVQLNSHHHNLFISTVKPQLVLESQYNPTGQSQLQLLQQLKSIREEYLKLVQENQSELQISDIIDIQFTTEYETSLMECLKRMENKKLSKSQFQVTHCQQVLETSFELEDSCQKPNNSNTLCRQSPLSNCNNLINPSSTLLTESAISIQDYSQTQNDKINHSKDSPQYTVNLIQSVIMPNSNEDRQLSSSQLYSIQQNQKFQSFAQNKNKSCESIIATLLSPLRDLQRSQCYRKVNNSRMYQSKSFFKQLACSKCSVDHDNQQSFYQKKNVKLQINLTEIYNYDCNFTEIQSFCVIKHNGQELRTAVSKGKFPNWKEELKIHVDFDQLNAAKNHQKNVYQSESSKVKIQLWAKPTHFKKDPYLNPNCMLQLIGEQIIDLREEKWIKRKIMLENNLESQQRKKTAYMYISLQKIKPKKL